MLNRAYSLLEVKAFDEAERVIVGIASTPTPDRGDDVMEPKGAVFQLPMPFLWQHNQKEPLGEVFEATVTPKGIEIKARVAKVDEPGRLKDRLDEAWQSIKAKLVRGLSVGWKPIEAKAIPGTFGIRAIKWLWVETSAVTIPMNAEASILAIKSADLPFLSPVDSGTVHPTSPVVSGTPVVRLKPSRLEQQMKTTSEQILSFKSTRDQKFAEMNEIMSKSAESGETLDAANTEKYDGLKAEIKALDDHITRLKEFEAFQKESAKPIETKANLMAELASARSAPVITMQEQLPPGIGFTRAVLCKTAAFLTQYSQSPLEIARLRYPSDQRVQAYLKANVPAGSTTDATWAGNLVDTTNLQGEFIEFLRPATIIGKFGTNGIPSLRRVPFNIRITGQTTGGNAWWVGQGKPKPVTSFGTSATTLLWAKLAAISVITEELARFSSPSAEQMVRDGLRDAIVQQMDNDFIDPATAAQAGVNPASITNGLTPLSSAGTSADNVRTDIQNLLEDFIRLNQDVTNLVLIMPPTLALALSLLVNDLGQREFPDITLTGGRLLGLPVITSTQAANASGSGNLVIAVNASEILLADDGQVTVDASREASLQMVDNPTVDSVVPTATSLVSMWQTNSIALRAERFINWAKRRAEAVTFMDDVNWGAIGSPPLG